MVSLHADMLRSWDIVDDQTKILSIKYDERQGVNESKVIADQLLNNWFWYYYNGKLSQDVKRDTANQRLWVLKTAQSPAVLVEFWNI
jgi:N-acetylmuramoyl-L-alanine amidase